MSHDTPRTVLPRISSAERARRRPGSILILVVALLVLMALIGTAFISTARFDRYSAGQNNANTQADLLLQGAMSAAEGTILRDIQPGATFRHATTSPTTLPTTLPYVDPAAYNHWDSPLTDGFLASRIPVANVDGAHPGWPYISAPFTGQYFEAPYAIDAYTNQPLPASQLPRYYSSRAKMVPTSLAISIPDSTYQVNGATTNPSVINTRTVYYPAFTVTDNDSSIPGYVPTGKTLIVLAADTDGDGIADAGLVRLPVGQVDGITYYAAVRTIDNCAALNVSVAMEPAAVPTSALTPPGDFFPTNINLRDLIAKPNDPSRSQAASNDYLALNAYKSPAPGSGTYLTESSGFRWRTAPIFDDTQLPRDDFAYSTQFEAAWFRLGSRLSNPGYNTDNSAPYKAVAIPVSESASLASRFCIVNANASPSPLESTLSNELYNYAPHTPYAAKDVTRWFNENFAYDTPYASPTLGADQGYKPLRPLLTVRNPVSNFAPDRFNNRGTFDATASYTFGDRVTCPPDPTDPTSLRSYVCIRPAGVALSPPNNPIYWEPMPWTAHPTRIGANTGTFGQLWTAYWSLMQDAPGGDTDTNVYQFRSPLRDGTLKALTRGQMIQLRSALAAVNTIDLRDGDEDVTSRTVQIGVMMDGTPILANVYGTEKQPFITEMVIHYAPTDNAARNPTDPAVWFITIELYNPHATPVSLVNWKLGSIIRGAGSLSVASIGDLSATLAGHTGGAVIQPGEKIVLYTGNIPTDIQNGMGQPPSVTPYLVQGGSLSSAIGNELVLLRPRRGDGGLTHNADPRNVFDEGASTDDLVPVDQIDLTGMQGPLASDANTYRYRYARANVLTSNASSGAWHCVYPGGYDIAAPGGLGGPFHHTGMQVVDGSSLVLNPANGTSIGRGKAPGAGATYETRPLQLNARDAAGPNRPYADNGGGYSTPLALGGGTTARFPFGGFARNGDILQVPFIGGYKIYKIDSNPNTVTLLEMNSVTMDSVYAQFLPPASGSTATAYDVDPASSPAVHNEQIGRFCPMTFGATDLSDLDAPSYSNLSDAQTVLTGWKYHWAKRLFDYVTVFSPQDDYQPNVDPNQNGDPTLPGASNVKYPGAAVKPVANGPDVIDSAKANNGNEDTVGIEGLININTADAKVLSTVPFFPYDLVKYPDAATRNANLAQAIVSYRESVNIVTSHLNGPFKSLFDLMKVPEFVAANQTISGLDPDDGDGDLSPFNATLPVSRPASGEADPTDHIVGDFESRYLLLNRVSNLLTTRSDSFTLYAQVIGLHGVGTPYPDVAVSRRAATVLDRSLVKPMPLAGQTTLTPIGVLNIPTN